MDKSVEKIRQIGIVTAIDVQVPGGIGKVYSRKSLLLASLILAVGTSAPAGTLTLLGSFGVPDASGVAFDPSTGHLWVTEDENDEGEDSIVREYSFSLGATPADTTANLEGSFAVDGVDQVGGAGFKGSNLILTDTGNSDQRILEYTTAGALVDEFSVNPPSDDPDGVYFDTATNQSSFLTIATRRSTFLMPQETFYLY